MVWLESPTNPTLDVADVPAIAAAVRSHATVVVDSTFATPMVTRPLSHGAHMVLHSATKFIGGHSDLMMGVVVVADDDDDRFRRLDDARWMNGATPGALESFLALRGLRTLPLRMERAQVTAAQDKASRDIRMANNNGVMGRSTCKYRLKVRPRWLRQPSSRLGLNFRVYWKPWFKNCPY